MSDTVKDIWGMCCPNCGDDQRIDICANVHLRLMPDGTDPFEATNQSHEWTDDCLAFCGTCDHKGTVATFTEAAGQS